MSDHSLLSPSSMHRILSCAASLAQSDGEPNDGNKYTWEGTAAHTLASDCLQQSLPALAFLGRIIEVKEKRGKSKREMKVAEFEVDEEMAGNVQIYLDYINDIVAANGSELYVEQKVDFSDIVEYPDSGGTSDAIMLHPISGAMGAWELHIVDFKYGQGVQVDAEENEQMMSYALGSLELFAQTHDIASVRMTVSQPRINHLSEWEISVTQLRAWGATTMKKGCNLALELLTRRREGLITSPHYFNPTPDNCKFCKGKATCPALRGVVREAIGVEFEDLDAETVVLDDKPVPIEVTADDEMLDALFPKLDMIYDWVSAVRTKIESRLFAGVLYTNAKLVRGKKGNRKWRDEAQAEADLKAMRLKLEEMYKMTLITPTQAEKTFKDNPKRLKKLMSNVDQAEGKVGVALMSDPADAYLPDVIQFDDLDAVGAEDLA